jgi:hypothetical protein
MTLRLIYGIASIKKARTMQEKHPSNRPNVSLPSKLIETYSMNTNWARVRNFNVILIAIFSFVLGETLKSEDFPYVNRKKIINHTNQFHAYLLIIL